MDRYLIFKDDEFIGTAFSRKDVGNIVRSSQRMESFKSKLSGTAAESRYWAVMVSESLVCVGAHGEFNHKWEESNASGWGYLNEND